MVFQILECQIFTAQDMKKNIKARMHLSDGNSKITTMVADKTFDKFVSIAFLKTTCRNSLLKIMMS